MNMDIANCPPGPLHGIRVVDLTTVMFGPYCTQLMGEMGADIIKVEAPEGDIGRQTGATRSPGMSAAHLMKGRNKRSVVLDLKQAVGLAALERLTKTADVFVHNIRPAAMRRLKLGAADVHAANARMVYVSLMGYGESGPYAGRPAYDDLIQGITGIPSVLFGKVDSLGGLCVGPGNIVAANQALANAIACMRHGDGKSSQPVEAARFPDRVPVALHKRQALA